MRAKPPQKVDCAKNDCPTNSKQFGNTIEYKLIAKKTKSMTSDTEPLSLQAEFTRHVLSLFGSLYDNRAAPYIGPIQPDLLIEPTRNDEEEDDDDIGAPQFETALCDFKLKEAYKLDEDTRGELIGALSGNSDNISENSKTSTSFDLGPRLSPRTEKGTTIETELKKKREVINESRLRMQNERRERFLELRKAKKKELITSSRQEYKELMAHWEKVKRTERKQREATAKIRLEAMARRRQALEKKRIQDNEKQRQAEEAVKNVTYHAKNAPEAIARYDFRYNEKVQKQEMQNSVQLKNQAKSNTLRYTRQNIKPKSRNTTMKIFKA